MKNKTKLIILGIMCDKGFKIYKLKEEINYDYRP